MKDYFLDWNKPWGIISDAHGNYFGLDAAVEALREHDVGTIFFLGDALGYLPFASKVLRRLSGIRAVCLCGNHEAMALNRLPLENSRDRYYKLNLIKQTLSEQDFLQISQWTERLDLDGPLGKISMMHGGFDNPLEEYVYPDSDLSSYSESGSTAVFVGNTHRPFCKKAGNTTVVNVGSCGLPRDIGNQASCVVYTPSENIVKLIRVPFDAEAVISASEKYFLLEPAIKECLRRKGS